MHLYYWLAPTRAQLDFSRQLFFFFLIKIRGDVFCAPPTDKWSLKVSWESKPCGKSR